MSNDNDLRGLMAFARMSNWLGIGLDMLCEISSYYLHRPWIVMSLVYMSGPDYCNSKTIRGYTRDDIEEYEDGYEDCFYEYAMEAFLDYMSSLGAFYSWKQDRYPPCDILILDTRESRNYIMVSYDYLIGHLKAGTLTHLCEPFNQITSKTILPFAVKLIKN